MHERSDDRSLRGLHGPRQANRLRCKMNISFTIGVDAENLDTGRFDPLGEGMTRRFIRSGENTRPDGSTFMSPDDKLMFTAKIRDVASLTDELETRLNVLNDRMSRLETDEEFSVYINVAAYHQDDQFIDLALGRELIRKLNETGIEIDIEVYRFCPW